MPLDEMDDLSFVSGLKNLVNIDEDTAKKLIANLEIDQINELSNAVANNDKRRALQIYYSIKDQIDDKEVTESVNNLNVGDIVYVGKKKARVQIPNGPGDTVGVIRKDKLKMVKRSNISLSEDMSGVLGMTMLPGIARMQELAGLSPTTSDSEVETRVIDEPEDEDEKMTIVWNAIHTLRDTLPEITLKDAKLVRKALNDMLISMNESAPAPTGRKLKD